MFSLVQNILLPYRVVGMCLYLQSLGINCKITKFLRKKRTAHRWSTAHHIVFGKVSIGALRRLEDGRDRDGFQWYKPEWDDGSDDSTSANSIEEIRQNAITLGAPNTEYALEGYGSKDPARLPNLGDIPISKHVYGLAIDVLVDWSQFGGAWSQHARETVSQFGLIRPVPDEPWHFEIDQSRYFVVGPHRIFFLAIKHLSSRR